jgi:hypothetical protein
MKKPLKKVDLFDASHPARKKAIQILERIAELMGDDEMFDGMRWYDLEDAVTEIVARKGVK